MRNKKILLQNYGHLLDLFEDPLQVKARHTLDG